MAAEQPDPATFALPADAGVAAGGSGQASSSDAGAVPPSSAGASDDPIDKVIAALPIDPELVESKPEILVGAAFAGAFILARILKRITTE